MYFYLIGIDYKKAPLNIREGIYSRRKEILYFWDNLYPHTIALLLTCNRFEVYGVTKDAGEALNRISEFSREFPDFLKYAYLKYGEKEIFKHALRLASGLESQLKGEQQIFTQLTIWHIQASVPFPIKKTWEEALLLAKQIRLYSGLNQYSQHIANVVCFDLSKRLKQKRPVEIVVVGTGKIAELFSGHLNLQLKINFVAHKNYQRAEQLAECSRGKAFRLEDLPLLISEADVLISATKSPHYILKKVDFEKMITIRNNPLFVYDLAIPLDVEPSVKDLRGVFLQNIDDLSNVFEEFNRNNYDRIILASKLVEEALRNKEEALCVK